MKIIVTGTVGVDKAAYLEQVRDISAQAGQKLTLYHIGQRMYAEAPDIAPGRILDLPLARLHQLRRSVFKDILSLSESCENLIVNTHATFRWKHGLFPAFDFNQLAELGADMYVCLVDSVDAVHARLIRDHLVDHCLKDLLVWREEELLATGMMMLGCSLNRKKEPAKFYALSRGPNGSTVKTLYRLIFQPDLPRAYLSFPMTHVADMPSILHEIRQFRKSIGEHLIVFDPADLEEHQLHLQAVAASEQGRKVMEVQIQGRSLSFDVAEVMQVAGDIHAQIYARDFLLIDQSDMIISYIPQLPDGRPSLSSGVERELQHAHEATKEVFVIWRPQVRPSPFVTGTATRIFTTIEEALQYFHQQGYFKQKSHVHTQ